MVAKRARTAAAEESHRSGHGEVYRAIQKLKQLQEELEKVKQLQEELEQVNENVREKMTEFECKFKQIRDPVYARRNNIINTIPDFWPVILLHHPMFENMLTGYNREIFCYLDSLNVEDFPDPRKGYCITFTFKPNPYFENTKLTKTIKFSDDGTLRSVGTGILWKPLGKRNDERRRKRLLPSQSFCNWISTVNTHQDVFAEIIKEDIWPNPIEHLYDGDDDYDDDSEDDEDEGQDKGDGNNDDGV